MDQQVHISCLGLVRNVIGCREEDIEVLHDSIALSYFIRPVWAIAYGTPNSDWVGYYCGNYLHASMYLTNGAFHSDFDYYNHVILPGNQQGFLAGLNATVMTRKMAEARQRGIKVVAKVTECIHPEVVGIAGVFVGWAEGEPVAKGKDVHFSSLLPLNMSRVDSISSGVDSCIRVKVSRAA
jgi:hypothetical protein